MVLLINGSPKKNGCTYTALSEVARILEEEGLEARIEHASADKAEIDRLSEEVVSWSLVLLCITPLPLVS